MKNSILEDMSWQFQDSNGQIFDNTKENVLEFFPAGYTQKIIRKSLKVKGAAEAVNRQEFYKELYYEAIQIGKELEQFPFKEYEYKIVLVPEPSNRYDPFAIKVEFSLPSDSEKEHWNQFDIGYVPKLINKYLIANDYRITDIKILNVTNDLNDKFYCARIAIGYDGVKFEDDKEDISKRFKRILYSNK